MNIEYNIKFALPGNYDTSRLFKQLPSPIEKRAMAESYNSRPEPCRVDRKRQEGRNAHAPFGRSHAIVVKQVASRPCQSPRRRLTLPSSAGDAGHIENKTLNSKRSWNSGCYGGDEFGSLYMR